jgi:hypothetical protein
MMDFIRMDSQSSMMRVASFLVVIVALIIALTVTVVWAIKVLNNGYIEISGITGLIGTMLGLGLAAKVGQKIVELKNHTEEK